MSDSMFHTFSHYCTPPPPTHTRMLGLVQLLFRCGPPRYRPSAVQPSRFCCRPNEWFVSVAVSADRRRVGGLSGALHFPPLCSATGRVLTLIDSFPRCSLSKSPSADLQRPPPSPGICGRTRLRFLTVDRGTLFVEGGGRDDRPCEWKMIGEHNLKPQQLPFQA